MKQWHEKYKDKGLVVVGVHTPEYPHERSTANVTAALKRFDIRYPVAQDNRYATWEAYRNQFWPAIYASFDGDEETYLRVARRAHSGAPVAVRVGLLAVNDRARDGVTAVSR